MHSSNLLALAALLALVAFAKSKAYMLFFIPWLSIPKDEFHPSLEMDWSKLDPLNLGVPSWVRWVYTRNLIWRRNVAHRRDMRRSN